MKKLLLLAVAVTILAACVGTPSFTPTNRSVEGALAQQTPSVQVQGSAPSVLDLRREAARGYLIGPQDQLVVQVWGRPDLGSQIPAGTDKQISTVKDDGTIFLPFLGDVTAGGRTVEELTQLINRMYSDVVEDPQVDVQLEACRSQAVYVTGAVKLPGKQYLCAWNKTAGDAIAATGGPTEEADSARAMLTRAGAPFNLDYEAAVSSQPDLLSVTLEAGDTIHFPTWEERQVYVFGEVVNQGAIPIPETGMTLLRALADAGGHRTTAKTKTIYLAQQRGNSFAVHQLALEDLLINPDIPLQDGDRIFIPPTDLTRWSRWWFQALPFNFAVRAVGVE